MSLAHVEPSEFSDHPEHLQAKPGQIVLNAETLIREREEWRCHQLEHWEREKQLSNMITNLKKQLAHHSSKVVNDVEALDDDDEGGPPETPTTSDSYSRHSILQDIGRQLPSFKRSRRESDGDYNQNGPYSPLCQQNEEEIYVDRHDFVKLFALIKDHGKDIQSLANNLSDLGMLKRTICTIQSDTNSLRKVFTDLEHAFHTSQMTSACDSLTITELEKQLSRTRTGFSEAINNQRDQVTALHEALDRVEQITHNLTELKDQGPQKSNIEEMRNIIQTLEMKNQELSTKLRTVVTQRDTFRNEVQTMSDNFLEKSAEAEKLSENHQVMLLENVELRRALDSLQSDQKYVSETTAMLQDRVKTKDRELTDLTKANEKALKDAYELHSGAVERLSAVNNDHRQQNKDLMVEIDRWKSTCAEQTRRGDILSQQKHRQAECLSTLEAKVLRLESSLDELQRQKEINAHQQNETLIASFPDEEQDDYGST